MRRSPTGAESKLWQRLRRRQLEGYKFRRQHIVAGFVVDFYCTTLQFAVEVDGPIHRYQQRYDQRRSQLLQAYGVAIVRFSSEAVMYDIEHVVALLRNYIQRRRQDCSLG
jgi:very-short-patch-repair endonuclease